MTFCPDLPLFPEDQAFAFAAEFGERLEAGVGRQRIFRVGHGREKHPASDHDQLLARSGDGHVETVRVVQEFAHDVIRIGRGERIEDDVTFGALHPLYQVICGTSYLSKLQAVVKKIVAPA